MKRELYFLAILGLALPLVGCGGSSDNDDNNNPPAGAPFVGLQGNRVVRGDIFNADEATSEPLSGIPDGVDLIALDDRPANGDLVALGSDNRLYTIDLGSSSVTAISGGAFTPAVTGTAVAFDFNPTVDRIRLIGNDGQNLRLNPVNGAVAATDTPISDPNAEIVGAAYTNNFAGATSTTLYAIDAASDSLVRVGGVNGSPSPNGGVVTTIGDFGFDITDDASFDIATDGEAYLVNGTTIYRVDLTNADTVVVGQLNNGLDGFAVIP